MLHIFDIKEEIENQEKNNEQKSLIKIIGSGIFTLFSSLIPIEYEDSYWTKGASISFTHQSLKMSNLVGYCVDKIKEVFCFTSDGTYYLFNINYSKKTIEKIYERNMKVLQRLDVNNNKNNNYIPL